MEQIEKAILHNGFNGEARAEELIAEGKTRRLLIVTHGENFHADDVMAYAVLNELFREAEFVRTRDPEIIEQADIVFDVGMEYDPSRHRYDHHQRVGSPMRQLNDGTETPYSSAGLIWRFFGRNYLRSIGVTNRKLENILWSRTDEVLFSVIDAMDNGLQKGRPPGIIDVISSYNLSWDEDNSDEAIMTQFLDASRIAGDFLINMIKRFHGAERARIIVLDVLMNSPEDDILVLPAAMPFKTVLQDSPVKFVIMPDSKTGNYQIQSVPQDTIYENKALLPKRWRGLANEELQCTSMLPDAVFVHRNGFFGVAGSIETAMIMAREGVRESEKDAKYAEMEAMNV